jgi:cytochrome c-type biogenesis protein CcmE
MKKYGKFAALIAVVLGTLIWLATTGMSTTKTYYKTIAELGQMGDNAYGQHIRVAGDIESGTIQHAGQETRFVLIQDKDANNKPLGTKLKLKVAYTGSEPLPDTFRDGAQALADGKLDHDGVFRAGKIQAKCASKYEAKPGQTSPVQSAPNVYTGKSSL